MKILGLDTTTRVLSIGIYDNAKVYEYNLEVGVKLSSLLTITLKRILGALGWQASGIDYFACGLGPGSFTGVRVGLAAIKGLAYALNKPVIGIPTLDILARNANTLNRGPVVPMIDAKRNLIYCTIYQAKNGIFKRTAPYMLLTEAELLEKVKTNSIILGDAASLYKEKLARSIKGLSFLDRDYWYPKAGNIIALAQERIKEKKFNNPFKIKPIYLYPKDCQCVTTARPGPKLI